MLVVYLNHIVVDRLCVRRRLKVLDLSLWYEFVQEHICVFELSYIVSKIVTLLLILLLLYSLSIISFLCYLDVHLEYKFLLEILDLW